MRFWTDRTYGSRRSLGREDSHHRYFSNASLLGHPHALQVDQVLLKRRIPRVRPKNGTVEGVEPKDSSLRRRRNDDFAQAEGVSVKVAVVRGGRSNDGRGRGEELRGEAENVVGDVLLWRTRLAHCQDVFFSGASRKRDVP